MLITRTMARLFACAVVVGVLFTQVGEARADARDRLKKKSSQAMEAYDFLEFAKAKKLLNEALVFAKRNDLADDPVAAQVHINLAIVYFSGFQDEGTARLELLRAVEIDPSVEIPLGYQSKGLSALLDEARAEADAGGGGGEGGGDGCGSVEGLEHDLVDASPSGVATTIEAKVARRMKPAKVSLFYRASGADEFVEIEMERDGKCRYVGEIPGDAIAGDFVHYYVAALDRRGDRIDGNGSRRSPNLIEVKSPLGDDGENPLGDGDDGGDDSGSGGRTLFLSLGVGSGGGYVTGNTEQEKSPVGCCVAPALLHVLPEIGYYFSPQTAVSVALRMGFPIGADIENHATGAPSILVRMRRSFSAEGGGGFWSAAVGGGVIRHTVKLQAPEPGGGTTDTTASGPLLLGAGAGYAMGLSGSVDLVAEFLALAGVPVGPAPSNTDPNFGLQFDFNLGLVVGF